MEAPERAESCFSELVWTVSSAQASAPTDPQEQTRVTLELLEPRPNSPGSSTIPKSTFGQEYTV